jgi:murein tripeptide amidase MpaA
MGISEHSVMVEDVQKALDDMLPKGLGASSDGFALDQYHTFDDTDAWMKQLAEQYSDICEYVKVGTSYQGRQFGAIKITGKTGASGKKAFWMDGGIHAREWITTAAMNWMLSKTLELYGSDETVTNIVDNLNLYYAPVINPDGYSYTWTDDRMHRKTMMPNGCSSNTGTDPNRNWAFHWGEAGQSSNPCSDSYSGKAAGDQPEVAAVQDFVREKDDFLGYINFHSYSQLWMSPWGYTSAKPKDYQVQNAGSKAAVEALEAVHGTRFEYGPISTTIYPASGSSADYTYGVANVLFSYGVELRDTGRYGFTLPANQIVPSGEETFAGVKALAKYMIAHISSIEV